MVTLTTMLRLARAFSLQTMFQESENTCLKTIDTLKSTYRIGDELTLDAINKLGLLYSQQIKFQQAIELKEECVELLKETLGMENRLTIGVLIQNAGIYGIQGNFEKAEKIIQELLPIVPKMYGEYHLSTTTLYVNAANIFASQNKDDEATKYYLKSFNLLKEFRGMKDINTLIVLQLLGSHYEKIGKLKEAEELLESWYNHMNELDPMLLRTISNAEHLRKLATIYGRTNKLQAAIDIQNKAVEIFREKNKRNDPSLIIDLIFLATLYMLINKWDEVPKPLSEALIIEMDVRGFKDEKTLFSMQNLGRAYIKAKNYVSAESLLVPCYELMKEVLGEDHFGTKETKEMLDSLRNATNPN